MVIFIKIFGALQGDTHGRKTEDAYINIDKLDIL